MANDGRRENLRKIQAVIFVALISIVSRCGKSSEPRAAAPSASTSVLPDTAFWVEWQNAAIPTTAPPEQTILVKIDLKNASTSVWPNRSPDQPEGFVHAVRLGYRWFRAGERVPMITYDQIGRFPLPKPLGPGESTSVTLEVKTPPNAGDYDLQVDLVQEHVAWFEAKGAARLRRSVRVE